MKGGGALLRRRCDGVNLSLDCYREDTAALWYPPRRPILCEPRGVHRRVGRLVSPARRFKIKEILPGKRRCWLEVKLRSAQMVSRLMVHEDGAVLRPTGSIRSMQSPAHGRQRIVTSIALTTSALPRWYRRKTRRRPRARRKMRCLMGRNPHVRERIRFRGKRTYCRGHVHEHGEGGRLPVVLSSVDDTGAPVLDESRMIDLLAAGGACGLYDGRAWRWSGFAFGVRCFGHRACVGYRRTLTRR